MFSFTILTTTPAALRNQLIARGVLQSVTETNPKGTTVTQLVGVNEGLEWKEVANPIVTSLAVGNPGDVGYTPAVMDTRKCYLVKLVRAAQDNEIAGLTQDDTIVNAEGTTITTKRSLLLRTKLGAWVLANSAATTLTSADGRSWPARRVGTTFWMTISDDFGVWQ